MTLEASSQLTEHLPTGLAAVEEAVARACKEARRDRASVNLIAVSKTFDADAIEPVIKAGQVVFGENRVQEARSKWPGLMSAYAGISLHLVGPSQGHQLELTFRYIDVFVMRAGRWQCVASQSTKVPAA